MRRAVERFRLACGTGTDAHVPRPHNGERPFPIDTVLVHTRGKWIRVPSSEGVGVADGGIGRDGVGGRGSARDEDFEVEGMQVAVQAAKEGEEVGVAGECGASGLVPPLVVRAYGLQGEVPAVGDGAERAARLVQRVGAQAGVAGEHRHAADVVADSLASVAAYRGALGSASSRSKSHNVGAFLGRASTLALESSEGASGTREWIQLASGLSGALAT